MKPFYFIFLGLLLVLAIISVAVFSFPAQYKEFAKVEISGISLSAEVVSDPEARIVGLAGRPSLNRLSAMLFSFEDPDKYGIWMKGMKFPIDIFWIKDGVVVDLEEKAPVPFAGVSDFSLPVYRPDVPADFVLETGAGFAGRYKVNIGDRVKIYYGGKSLIEKPASAAGFSAAPDNSSKETDFLISVVVPGEEYFIENLRKKDFSGRDFQIKRNLGETDVYQKFQIEYKTGDFKISGVMNVPKGKTPDTGFPVLILNHGLIRPEIYFTGRGSKREQDFFARHGYITIHPDYRGLASSTPNPQQHHDFYMGYTEDVLGLIEAIKKDNSGLFDSERIGMWGHFMGGGIAARAMVLNKDIRAYVLFASISADVKDGFYELPLEEIGWLKQTYGEGENGDRIYNKISPLNYFENVQAPVQFHHGAVDYLVPSVFSQKMFNALKRLGKKAEFYEYAGEGHEFGSGWDLAAERALQFFDLYVKRSER